MCPDKKTPVKLAHARKNVENVQEELLEGEELEEAKKNEEAERPE
jgi:hypothetical protein